MKINKKIINIFFLLILVSFLFFTYIIFNKKNDVGSINMDKIGYLYSVSDLNNKKHFLAVEKELENLPKANFPANLNITFLDRAKIWDPTVCAGMPTVVSKNNIWMIDFRVNEEQKIEKILIKYNKNDNTKYYLNLNKYNIIGDLSFENDSLVFKIEENDKIYNVKIEDKFYESLKYKILYIFFGIYPLNKDEILYEPVKIKKTDIKEYSLDLNFLMQKSINYYIIGEYKEN